MSTRPISDFMLEVLAAQGNRTLNDLFHEELCACGQWPSSCSSHYTFGLWDTDAFVLALPAIIARYEELKGETP